MCGCSIAECAERKVYCHRCNRLMDRDENAALNIPGAGLRFDPKGVASEAVKGNPERGKVIPGADATQLTLQPER